MQETATKPASAAVELKDARLFREACYVDGQWIQSKSGAAINVDNPATGESLAACQNWVAQKQSKRSKRPIALSGLEQENSERARRCSAPLVRFDDGEPGGSGAADDPGTGKPSPNRKAKSLMRLPSSNGSAKRPNACMGTPFHSIKRTSELWSSNSHRSRCLHHAVEFSLGHDHAQSGPAIAPAAPSS